MASTAQRTASTTCSSLLNALLYLSVGALLLPLLTTLILLLLLPLILYFSLLLDSAQLLPPSLLDWVAKLGLGIPDREGLLALGRGVSGVMGMCGVPWVLGISVWAVREGMSRVGWRETLPGEEDSEGGERRRKWLAGGGGMLRVGYTNWLARDDLGALPPFNARLAAACILLLAILVPQVIVAAFQAQAEAEKERAEASRVALMPRENAVER